MRTSFMPFLDLIARGGGGGSSGGGGGGGGGFSGGGGSYSGGSSGGTSNPAVILLIMGLLLGTFGAYAFAILMTRRGATKKRRLIYSLALIPVALIPCVALNILAGPVTILFSVGIALGCTLGWIFSYFNTASRMEDVAQKTKERIAQSAQTDSTWNYDMLVKHAETTFLDYQKDWSEFNLARIMTYTTESYAKHAGLMLRILKEMNRVDTMQKVAPPTVRLIGAIDETDNTKDIFTALIHSGAEDILTDKRTDAVLYKDNSTFSEYWTFTRNKDTWLLAGIEQTTANASSTYVALKEFAAANGMYYSADMGWLFLPNSGVLFSGGRFGVSDINNHIVGLYADHLVQLYTYRPYGIPSEGVPTDILVGQINLPKSYEGILVRRKTGFLSGWKSPKAGKQYKQYTLEWPDFNKRYDVYATNQDRLATFELLNPAFMAFLYDTDPGISIEVADNVVYLYKAMNGTDPQQSYTVLMQILNRAFKELRL